MHAPPGTIENTFLQTALHMIIKALPGRTTGNVDLIKH